MHREPLEKWFTHSVHPTCATHHLHEGFCENQAATLKWTVLFTITFAGTIRELQSLLRMEKILSWQAARGWKISRGTEREQVTDTSMDLPLVSSVGVISKSCLDIKTNENIFLPETLFTEHLNSFVENWPAILKDTIWPKFLSYLGHQEHPSPLLSFCQALSSFYSPGWNKEQTDWGSHKSVKGA